MHRSFFAALAATIVVTPTLAQHLVQTQTANPPSLGGNLGRRVTLGTEFAAAFHRAGGSEEEVYVYRRSPVELEFDAVIHAPPGSNWFGTPLAIQGSTLVVGATQANGSGRVYVFERIGGVWTLEATLNPSTIDPIGRFGAAVDIDGDTIVVGAHGENAGSTFDGYSYFFEKSPSGWTEVARVRPAAAPPAAQFGREVAIDGDLAVIGALFAGGGFQYGAAWAYRRVGSSWTLESELIPAAPLSILSQFGSSVDVEGERIVVSAWQETVGGDPIRGAVHVFERSFAGAWSETGFVVDPLGQSSDFLGGTVELDGGILLASSTRRGNQRDSAGLSFVDDPSGWRLDQVMRLPFDPTPSSPTSGIGFAMSLDCGQVLMGAPTDPLAAFDGGSLRLYDLDRGTTRYCASVPNSTGATAALFADGCHGVAVNRFQLRAINVPDGFGLGFYGDLQTQTVFGDGFSCVGGSLYRLPVAQASGGTLRIHVDFTAPSAPLGTILAGSTWAFQTLYRDIAAGGTGFNSSDAVSVTFGPSLVAGPDLSLEEQAHRLLFESRARTPLPLPLLKHCARSTQDGRRRPPCSSSKRARNVSRCSRCRPVSSLYACSFDRG